VSEWSIRLPTALIGIVNIALIYAVGLKLFRSAWYAAVGALMLALTAAHLLLSRMAVDYVCPLPFVLGWLWCLLTALETNQSWFAFYGGLLLGMGCYSYIAAWIMMPVYLLITCVTLFVSSGRIRPLIAAGVGFSLALVPAVVWMRIHPETLAATLLRYQFAGAGSASLMQPFRSLSHYYVIQGRLSLYWNYFDPVFLFLTGSSDPTLSTRKAGVFLIAAAVLLAAGIYEIVRRSDRATVLLAGLASAPLAPVLIDTGNAIQRELVLLPFAALIAYVSTGLPISRTLRAPAGGRPETDSRSRGPDRR
jgi:4-amino-4-deoxy-L-arabinose transferase-like glycosyltransferase